MKKIFARTSILATILAATITTAVAALASPNDYAGLIQIGTDGAQAVDIVDAQGNPILPDDLTAMLKSGTDISLLNPATNDVWQNIKQGKNKKIPSPLYGQMPTSSWKKSSGTAPKLNSANYTLGLQNGLEAQLISSTPSIVEEFRFIINVHSNDGDQQYIVVLGRKAHNYLLRKALLEKIGYQMDPMQWMPSMRVTFGGHPDVMGFQSQMKDMVGSTTSWIRNDITDASVNYVDLQDVFILPAIPTHYSPEAGEVTSDVIQGRRVLNALLVPFFLTDVPESVNSFDWDGGKIFNQSVSLPYEWAGNFNPSFQDAQWITRLIASLTPADWTEITTAAQVPAPVAALMAEKLKTRRNQLVKRMNLSLPALKADTKISSGQNLVDGKITLQNWPITGDPKGPMYASRFSFGDPANPISPTEIKSILHSKATSTAINSIAAQFNSYLNNNSSAQNKESQHYLSKLVDALYASVTSHTVQTIPLGANLIPTWSGGIIPSREVVIGSYLGTDNMIQMADSLTLQVSPGAFVGIDGLNAKFNEAGHIGLKFQRTYTHVTPVASVEAANKAPYKNILVPLLEKRFAKTLSPIDDLTGKADLETLAAALDQDMVAGDSLIVTDSLSFEQMLNLAYPLAANVTFQMGWQSAEMKLHRIHIHKVDKYTFDIYNDPGTVAQGGASFGAGVYGVPIMNLTLTGIGGEVTTHMYRLVIGSSDPNDMAQRKALYTTNMQTLRRIIFDNSIGAKSDQGAKCNRDTTATEAESVCIGHKFSEKDLGLNFLFFNYRKAKVKDRFLFTDPKGGQRSVLYRSTGDRNGIDYATLVTQMFTDFLQRKSGNQNLAIDATSNGDPSATIGGKAVTRQVIYEGIQTNPQDEKSSIADRPDGEYAQVVHVHKGWSITKDQAQQIADDMKRQYGYEFFNPLQLNDTKKIELYSISLVINIYRQGLVVLANLPPKQVEKLLTDAFITWGCASGGSNSSPECHKEFGDLNAHFYYFKKAQKDYLDARRVDGPKASQMALDLVDMAEAYFPGKALVDILGGSNVFVTSRIDGFKEGSEQGQTSILGSTMNLIGSSAVSGPLSFIQQTLKDPMQQPLNPLSGEFFLSWLLNPL